MSQTFPTFPHSHIEFQELSVRHCPSGRGVVLLGGAGFGKTSILERIVERSAPEIANKLLSQLQPSLDAALKEKKQGKKQGQ